MQGKPLHQKFKKTHKLEDICSAVAILSALYSVLDVNGGSHIITSSSCSRERLRHAGYFNSFVKFRRHYGYKGFLLRRWRCG